MNPTSSRLPAAWAVGLIGRPREDRTRSILVVARPSRRTIDCWLGTWAFFVASGRFEVRSHRRRKLLMTEGGLALFLVDAGLKAGKDIGPVFAEHGLSLCVSAALIATLPMIVGYFVGRFWILSRSATEPGATCGGMTSTPGLAVLTAANDSSQCITCYVAAYPVALVLMTVLAPLLVGIMQSIQ